MSVICCITASEKTIRFKPRVRVKMNRISISNNNESDDRPFYYQDVAHSS